jgi:glutamate---cysteine ligase / carboxylate-amine ligase
MTETAAGQTGLPPAEPSPGGLLTVGVEEEFLLVDQASGRPVPGVEDVIAELAPQLRELVQHEYLTSQVEIGSAPVVGLDALGRSLRALREALADAADRAGLRLLAVGTSPLPAGTATVVDTPRFRRMAERFRALSPGPGVCGCHVHVGIPDRETGVQVLNHLRPWLPILAAATANSPFFNGRDTGYASWRSMVWSQWPSVSPTPYLESATYYDELVEQLIDSGAMLDAGMLYWHARLSTHLPTVELRIGDVCPTVTDAVLIAGLARALVATLLDDVTAGRPAPPVRHHLLVAAHWRAARDGLEGMAVEPGTGHTVSAWHALERLFRLVTPALRRHGDLDLVAQGLDRLRAEGTGATRQRAAVQRHGDIAAVLPYLGRLTRGECES